MIILAMVSAMHLESNIWHGICQSWWTVTHIHLSLSVDKQDKTDLLPWACSNLLHSESLGKRISTDDLTHGILCHIMSQHFRRHMCLFQCYLLLVIKWRQRCFSGAMLHEMGSKENNQLTSDMTQGAQKYFCMLFGDKGHYLSKCSKPQVLYFIKEYDKGISNIKVDVMFWRSYRWSCFCSKM